MWLRLALGAVYTAMAAGQTASWTAMPAILGAYQVGGPGAMRTLAVALIVAELGAGLWFLTRRRSTGLTPVWIYAAVSVVWAGLGAQAFVRGLPVANCGCFGVHLSQRLSWFTLAQDALLLGYAAVMIRGGLRAGHLERVRASHDDRDENEQVRR
jgi:hypothetical protein